MALLLYLQLKRAIRTVPRLLLGALIPLLLTGLAVLYARRFSGTGNSSSLISPVALVNYDEQADLDFMLPYFSEIDAASGFQFVEMTEDAAMNALADGSVCAVLIFPEKMLIGIIDSTNTPARLYLPQNSAIASMLIGKFAQSGAQTLGAAQSAIYTASDLYNEYELRQYKNEIYYDINLATMHYALAREDLFSTRSVSATGSLSLVLYFGATVFVCLLLFLCSGMGSFLCGASGTTLRAQLKRNGIGTLLYELSMFLPLLLFYALLVAGLFAAVCCFLGKITLSAATLCFLGSTVLCITLFAQLIFRLFAETGRGILVFLFGGLFMIFLAGGFLPYAFLPVLFQKITPYLPLGAILSGLRHLFGAAPVTADTSAVLLHCLVLFGLFLPVCLFLRKEDNA